MTIGPSQHDGELERPVHLNDDDLSAYINGEITDPEERGRLEAHLDGCAECRQRLTDTQTVVSLLNLAETSVPSRSFKLDPGMVRPAVVTADSWFVRVQPAMRRLTAIAAALLLVIVMADALTNRGTGGGSSSTAFDVTTSEQQASGGVARSAANNATAASESSAQEATPAAALAAPAITASGTAGATTDGQQPPKASVPEAPQTAAEAHSGSGPSYWRLSEFAAGVVVVWLLFLTVAIPRLQHRREPR